MKVYIMHGMAWVEIDQGYLVCIGTEDEARTAEPQRLLEMIDAAIIKAQYNSIVSPPSQRVH